MLVNKFSIVVFFFLLAAASAGVFAQSQPDALNEYRLGNWQQAVDICKAEIEANPENLESYVVGCWSLIKMNQFEQARIYAETARSLSRYDVRVIEILGEINYHLGRNKEALQYFQEYMGLAPEGQRIETAYYYAGEIYIRLGRFRHADIALSTALHYVPLNAAWWTRLGYARENSGDLREAVAAYEKAISLNANNNDAQRGLARVRNALSR